MIEDLNQESIKLGLKLNVMRAEIMHSNMTEEREFTIGNRSLDCIQEYVYLGQLLTGSLITETAVSTLILSHTLVTSVFWKMKWVYFATSK